jgi:hypothetical protein
MTEIKQCWAFHRDGTRCEHPAGHSGDHMIEKTWTDSECSIPGETKSQPVIPVLPKPPTEQSNKCVACGHAHKSAECKCGCHTFIG